MLFGTVAVGLHPASEREKRFRCSCGDAAGSRSGVEQSDVGLYILS